MFVLPLEDKLPVLKHCKESWGAKWALRKANSSVSRILLKAEKEEQKAEAAEQEMERQANEEIHGGQAEEGSADIVGAAGAAGAVDIAIVGATTVAAATAAASPNIVARVEEKVLPGIGFLMHGDDPPAVASEHPDIDVGYQACRALFNESKGWLASGAPRYK